MRQVVKQYIENPQTSFPIVLRTQDLCEILSISKSTLYTRIKSGIIPPPNKQGGLNTWTTTAIHKLLSDD